MNFEATEISKPTDKRLSLPKIYHISCLSSERVWISSKDGDIVLTDETYIPQGTIKGISGYGIHTIADCEDLLYITQTGNINRVGADMKTEEFIKIDQGKASCICFSKINGDILILITESGPNPKLVRYTVAGHKVNETEYDKKGNALYENVRYVTENVNGDVCVSDAGKNAVIVTDKFQDFRFTYRGHSRVTKFEPFGLCSDKEGNIFVFDYFSKSVHVIDKDGQFLSSLRTNLKSEIISYGLSIDNKGSVWTVNCNNQIKIYQYQRTEDGKWMVDFGH